MTTQTTQPAPPMIRLHKASLVLQLLAAHPQIAALPINWEIDARDTGLWARVDYGSPESQACVQALADVLGATMMDAPVKDRRMYTVYGQWLGMDVSLQAFGPAANETGKAVSA